MMLICDGCTDSTPAEPATLAMEAWIDSDGYPVVILSQALKPTATSTDIADMMARWAKVTISDGTDTVTMTGGVDQTVFPPFSYRTFTMRGKVGCTYTIEAEYRGMTVKAKSTILPPPEITDVSFTQISDTLYSGSVSFRAPATDDTCRYVLYSRVRHSESRHYPSMLGTATTYEPSQAVTMPLLRGKYSAIADSYQPNFVKGDTVDVLIARVDPVVYRFWDAYNNVVYFGNSIFITADTSLGGNVEGGYGVFSARGTARRVAVVE